MNDREPKSRSLISWVTANLPAIGLATSLVAAIAMVVLTLYKHPTAFEAGLLQIFILLTGLWGSYILGKKSALDAARDLIRPHARSAFRRVLALYASLRRLSETIQTMNTNGDDLRLNQLQALVDEQIWTGQDAMEDWRDIIPEDVAEIEGRSSERRNAESDQ